MSATDTIADAAAPLSSPPPPPQHPPSASAVLHDVIVVGAGMFGSSAAKYLVQQQPANTGEPLPLPLRVAVIGPTTNTHANCRGQHFDEARICRRVETLLPWAQLNNDGLLSYAATEAASGVSFYEPCGVVWVASREDRDAIVACMRRLEEGTPANQRAAKLPFTFHETAPEGFVRDTKASENVLAVLSDGREAEAFFDNNVSLCQFAEKNRKNATQGAGEEGVENTTTTTNNINNTNINGDDCNPSSSSGETFYVVERGPQMGGTVHPARYVTAQLTCAAKTAATTESFIHYDEEIATRITRLRTTTTTTTTATTTTTTTTRNHNNDNNNNDIVKRDDSVDDDGDYLYEVLTDKGNVYRAKKVLVAAASFAVYHNLIPKPTQQLLHAAAEYVVLLRVQPPPSPTADDDDSSSRVSTAAAAPEATASPSSFDSGTGRSAAAAAAEQQRRRQCQQQQPTAADIAASRCLPSVIRTTGALEEQFYCLPPRYYGDEGKEGWFVKMGGMGSIVPEDILSRSNSNSSSSNGGGGGGEKGEEGDGTPSAVFDVSSLAGAMDWYSGRTPLRPELVSRLAALLATVYPTWRVVTDDNDNDDDNVKNEKQKAGNGEDKSGTGGCGNESAALPPPPRPRRQNSFVLRCIWDKTADRSPVIDRVDDDGDTNMNKNKDSSSGLFVALGGNGRGAKACDIVGRLAAWRVLHGAAAPLPDDIRYYTGQHKAEAAPGIPW